MKHGPVLLTAALYLAALAPAFAHSVLRGSNPAEGAVLAQSPSELRLTFNGAIEERFSAIEISGPAGKVDAGVPRTEKQNEIAVALPVLPPGRYDVRWRVIAADSHKLQGTLHFAVRP
jgi:methionine-rich copper-binding protein CopC